MLFSKKNKITDSKYMRYSHTLVKIIDKHKLKRNKQNKTPEYHLEKF